MQTVYALALSGLQNCQVADVCILEARHLFFLRMWKRSAVLCCMATIDVCAAKLVVIKITRCWVW